MIHPTGSLARTSTARLAGAIALIVGLSACSDPDKSSTGASAQVDPVTSAEAGSTVEQRSLENWPALKPALPRDEKLEGRISDLLAQMTLEEKVGQMMQAEIKYITPEEVKQYHIGSILNGGGTFPNNDKFATPDDWRQLADDYFAASMDTSDGGVAIPIIWGSDAVHGHNNVIGATLFPHNIGLGAARDPELIRRIGEATAREVAVTGVDWTFAPTIAVVRDDRWGRTFESYSEDPEIVAAYAREMIKGIQGEKSGEEFLDGRHLVSAAKHFVGDGGTTRGIDRGDTQVSEKELAEIHAAGYFTALESGVQSVMASFNSWNGKRLHGHKYLLTDVLKDRLGFDGFVVGDWNGHRFVEGCTVDSCAQAVNAGLDMFMITAEWKALLKNTIAQVRSGEIPMSRIDDAVSRILRVKIRAGLFERDRPLAGKTGILGSPEHRALAREAVRKSLVLLKNNDQLLPVDARKNILVAGDGADNISKQSGGWTISWQGTGNTAEDFPGATSIYTGIKQAVDAAGGEVVLSEDGNLDSTAFNGEKPDVAIVVFGEDPYAEWHGDLASIEFQLGSKEDQELLQKLKAQDIPVVSVFLSGRPLWVNKEMNLSDAFVAAWLPGSEGAGVADVILTDSEGKKRYDFTGRLSFSWPELVHQTVINLGDENYAPLFTYGYGLDYTSGNAGSERLIANNLSENGETYVDGKLEDAWLMVSRPRAPWKLFIADSEQDPLWVSGNLASSADDNITVASIDMLSQEDARALTWKGLRAGSVLLQTQKPQDLSRYLEEGAALTMDVRVDQAPQAAVFARIACDGDNCNGSLPLQQALAALPQGDWSEISIDLQCFAKAGADFSKVSQGLSLHSEGKLAMAVANIKFVPGAGDHAQIRCGG
ncbi:glycoside hydrolase family 3 protein [Microbulbifer hydrolyticus]|uniref:Beta-glucosidase n=1 Tax=Microbulbifer hydrolyticus TaxID=48074 RepID=A0A6P1TAP7_9GAMM|nr:exo 1,3/1,4-beta-D-glucan glucohydrolase [Microbulbifer hydrolyticus]MBB5210835.1 beta-glucosidase [Microbulbifer hydrolyticus]QHQ38733.1 glycoside hydrolase family 3 protein [Microbulbifer hydrolyticus]